VAVETFEDVPGQAEFPGPEVIPWGKRPSETRRREFITARHCARERSTRQGVGYARPVQSAQGGRKTGRPLCPAGGLGGVGDSILPRTTGVSGVDTQVACPKACLLSIGSRRNRTIGSDGRRGKRIDRQGGGSRELWR